MEYKSKLVLELISILDKRIYLAKLELNKAIDFVKTYDTYMNQAAQYNNDNNLYIFYNSFKFSKLIYSDIFKKWLIKIILFNNTHIPYIHNVFCNTILIVTSNEANNECDFKLSTIFKENKETLKENNNIKSINSLLLALL